MRTCTECRKRTLPSVELYDYSASGLPIQLEGVTVYRCECGNSAVKIPAIEQLHRLIASDLAKKRGRLTGPEIRFMRTWLGLSSQDFAETMGVSPAQASRWQTEAKPMGRSAERLLRLLVLRVQPSCDYGPSSKMPEVQLEDVRTMGTDKNAGAATFALKHDGRRWKDDKNKAA